MMVGFPSACLGGAGSRKRAPALSVVEDEVPEEDELDEPAEPCPPEDVAGGGRLGPCAEAPWVDGRVVEVDACGFEGGAGDTERSRVGGSRGQPASTEV